MFALGKMRNEFVKTTNVRNTQRYCRNAKNGRVTDITFRKQTCSGKAKPIYYRVHVIVIRNETRGRA
jgi:hypothetical protein